MTFKRQQSSVYCIRQPIKLRHACDTLLPVTLILTLCQEHQNFPVMPKYLTIGPKTNSSTVAERPRDVLCR